ncbi:MAG: hypothetical protein HY680_02375 [Chloroflexi bacterium]|nr:hypothetical protein [Chloroflexota bacterium]
MVSEPVHYGLVTLEPITVPVPAVIGFYGDLVPFPLLGDRHSPIHGVGYPEHSLACQRGS